MTDDELMEKVDIVLGIAALLVIVVVALAMCAGWIWLWWQAWAFNWKITLLIALRPLVIKLGDWGRER